MNQYSRKRLNLQIDIAIIDVHKLYTFQPWLKCVLGDIISNMTSRIYKGMHVNAFGLPVFKKDKKSRIKKENRKKAFYHVTFNSPFKKDSSKDLIIMYDVPHDMKNERDWFRRHLVKFGYEMIQKSVWVGPSPLPKDFLDYLKEIKIGDKFKTFKLAKSYIEKS